jgi:hypothetical protein
VGDLEPQLVPGSSDATDPAELAFDEDRVAWLGDLLYVWRAGATVAESAPQMPGTDSGLSVSADRLVWANANEAARSVSLVTWHEGDQEPEVVWTIKGYMTESGSLQNTVFGDKIVFGDLVIRSNAEDSEYADTGLLLARRH